PETVYGVTLGLLGAVVVLMALVKPVRAARGEHSWQLGDALEGLRFVRQRPVLLGAISLDLFAVLFGGVTALLPIFAADVLGVGPAGLGALRAAPGAGAAVSAAVLAFRPLRRRVGPWMFGGVAAYGVATLV